jgi:hypothetical protein
MPFWSKFEFENGFAFAAFQMFLEIGTSGPRELYALSSNTELLTVASQQIGKTVTQQELNFRLQEYFVLHYWYGRSKAFDLYRETALRHQRLQRQVSMEEEHFTTAGKILSKLTAYFDSAEFMKEMTPKTALDALTKLVAIQRVSVGLPATGPLAVNQQADATSFEMIMRSVAQTQGAGQTQGGAGFGGGATHTKDMLTSILQDPRAAGALQEVIIRVSQSHSGVAPAPEKRFPGKPAQDYDVQDAQDILEAEVRELRAVP